MYGTISLFLSTFTLHTFFQSVRSVTGVFKWHKQYPSTVNIAILLLSGIVAMQAYLLAHFLEYARSIGLWIIRIVHGHLQKSLQIVSISSPIWFTIRHQLHCELWFSITLKSNREIQLLKNWQAFEDSLGRLGTNFKSLVFRITGSNPRCRTTVNRWVPKQYCFLSFFLEFFVFVVEHNLL